MDAAPMLIDRYLLRAQLTSFLIVFVSLAGLTFVVDAFSNLEDFITHAPRGGGLWKVLGTYYGLRLISFFDATSAILTLASAMFALSWLERHNELTALLAAGVSRWRIAKPILLFAIIVSGLAMTNRELVLPQVRDALSRNAQNLGGELTQEFEARYDHETEILFRGRTYQLFSSRIEAPSLLMPPSLADHGPQIDAAEAFWRPSNADHPAGYLLCGIREPVDIDHLQPLHLCGEAIVSTRQNAAWLQSGECFVVSKVSFEQMIGSSAWRQYASTLQLISAIHNPSVGAGASVPLTVHARVVAPALDITLLLFGIPLVLGPIRRGIFIAVGLCVGLTVVFFLVLFGSHALADGYIMSPSMGAWMPLLLLAPLAAWKAEPMWQ